MGSLPLRQPVKAHGATAVLVGLLLAASWLTIYASGGANTVPPHLVYVPVLLAGWRLGVAGAVVTAIVGGLATGPLLPAVVSSGAPQPVTDWAVRTAFFLAIGTFMAIVLQQWKRASEHAVHVAHRERDLAVRQSVFLQSASHEVRTPLTVILGVALTLEQRRLIAPAAAPLLESLKRAAGRLDRLCTMALASAGGLGDLDLSALEVVDLKELIAEIVSETDRPGAAQRMSVLLPPEARWVTTHPKLLRPALSALVENALKFSAPSRPVEIASSSDAEGVRVSIHNFGSGLDGEFLERAFDPFTQSDESLRREHEGLGIGLFAARNLAEQMGGRLTLANHARGGVEALLLLPRLAASDAPDALGRAV